MKIILLAVFVSIMQGQAVAQTLDCPKINEEAREELAAMRRLYDVGEATLLNVNESRIRAATAAKLCGGSLENYCNAVIPALRSSIAYLEPLADAGQVDPSELHWMQRRLASQNASACRLL